MPGREPLDGRFVIEEADAKHGGIGTIHRGRDLSTGDAVAIKVLRPTAHGELARFLRETDMLADLAHPAIVRYVAHGFMAGGEPYLVMPWLLGESLADRLTRGTLTAIETVLVAQRIAEALAFAHARGLVHRDIKPANLFLEEGDVARAVLIDFGVARSSGDLHLAELTDVGTMVGTLGYMAPEQARGEREVDARADVFALGCVLFKCLAGRAPFVGDNITAVLAKTLFEDAPRLRDVASGVPPSLERLVARMLAKEPARRPADGAALVVELRALEREPSRSSTLQPGPRPGITAGEQSLVSIVLAAMPAAAPSDDTLSVSPGAIEEPGRLAAVRAVAAKFGARLDTLANGLLVATLAATRGVPADAGRRTPASDGMLLDASATDQVTQAARLALGMSTALRGSGGGPPHVVLATGRGVLGGRLPVGYAIDRAVRLLRHRRREASAPDPARPTAFVDEVTAGLLDVRFETRALGDGVFELAPERAAQEVVRTLLGKPTPFVGRSRELGVLDAVFEACVGDPAAQCVLVTGAAGVGKSRLRYEFLRGVRSGARAAEVWSARGEPIVAGSPLRLLSQALRGALGLGDAVDGGTGPAAIARVRARVARHLREEDVARVSEFLGELVGCPFPDDDSVQLRAARQDAVLRGDQMRRAFFDFIEAECRARPLVLVLEDLHWGDTATLEIVDAAVQRLRELPFLVVGLGRPEVRDLFPSLWSRAPLTQVEVTELTTRASARLVREVLGVEVEPRVVERLVARAEGNAFFLEELIRAVAERGEDGELPETVVAMVQARLEKLPPDERRILRAASVFGEVFHTGGVEAILGGYAGLAPLAEQLEDLVGAELVTRRPSSRITGETEYVFRHAHVREAAYAMLTEHDRVLAHRLAGEWLEAAGEHDAFALAEHFERAGAPASAAQWYRRAAQQALEANDLAIALERARRGARGASGEMLGTLLLLQAEVHAWRGEHADVLERGEEAMAWLERGGDLWIEAAGQVAEACGRLGQPERLARLGEKLCELAIDLRSGRQVIACVRAATQLMFSGRFDLGHRLTAAVVEARDHFVAGEPATVAWIDYAQSVRALFAGDLGDNVRLKAAVVASFERAGDQRNACIQRVRLGYGWIVVGAHAEGERVLREALHAAQRMGLAKVSALAKHNLGLALARLGAYEEARAIESEALEAFEAQGDRRLAGASQLYLAWIAALPGQLLTAELHARSAVGTQENNPPILAEALATLGWVLLAGNRPREALEAARRALALLEQLGAVEDAESLIRLVHAQALLASKKPDDARAAIALAKDRLLARAERIRDPELRRLFLEAEPDNRKTLELAAAWCEGAGA